MQALAFELGPATWRVLLELAHERRGTFESPSRTTRALPFAGPLAIRVIQTLGRTFWTDL